MAVIRGKYYTNNKLMKIVSLYLGINKLHLLP